MLLVGVDVGGTFTDVVCTDGTRSAIVKVPSRPDSPGDAVISGIARAADHIGRPVGDVDRLIHGTTVATNAIVQRKGAVVGLLTTEGFRDVLEIGRIKRWNLYDWALPSQTPTFMAPRERRFGVRERVASSGDVLVPLDEDDVRRAVGELVEKHGVQAIAVCFLFAFANARHEVRARELIQDAAPGLPVSLSSEVDPEYREYERTAVTTFDAYVRPVVTSYMRDLTAELADRGFEKKLQVMQSRGAIASADFVVTHPIAMVKSGPAGGVAAARFVSSSAHYPNLIGLDIGGTSSDVCLVVDGEALKTSEGRIDSYPVRVPMVDVSSIGAGGGSLVWIDTGGRLRVGPESAGADPGPVCYGRGGERPTVTDASLLLGYLNPDRFAMGDIRLDVDAARSALGKVAEPLDMSAVDLALGVHRILNATMADQIRLVTVKRGYDPQHFALLAFGGAGALHAAALARDLSIPKVVVPPVAGVLSALGLLTAEIEHEQRATRITRIADVDVAELERLYQQLTRRCLDLMAAERVDAADCRLSRSAAYRYVGQSSELDVSMADEITRASLQASVEAFQRRHQQTYGYRNPDDRVELVSSKVTASYGMPDPRFDFGTNGAGDDRPYTYRLVRFAAGPANAAVYRRHDLVAGRRHRGPAVIEQQDTTTLMHPADEFVVDADGNLLIDVGT